MDKPDVGTVRASSRSKCDIDTRLAQAIKGVPVEGVRVIERCQRVPLTEKPHVDAARSRARAYCPAHQERTGCSRQEAEAASRQIVGGLWADCAC